MSEARKYGEQIAAALVEVVESARWEARIGSARELARLSGMTHTSVNKRLSGEVVITVKDLGAFSVALGVSPVELLRRAREIVDGQAIASVTALRPTSSDAGSMVDLAVEPSAAEPERRDDGDGEPHA